MKKTRLLTLLLSFSLLASCGQQPTQEPTVEPTTEPTPVPTVEPTVEPTTEPTPVPTVEPTQAPTVEPTIIPSEPEPTVEVTPEPTPVPTEEPSTDTWEGYERLDTILAMQTLSIGVNEQYNLRIMLEEEYQEAWIDIYVDNFDLLQPDVYDNINGLQVGKTSVKIVVEETYYDELTVEVLPQDEMNKKFTFDKSRLTNKTFTVFGDSISDVNHTAYPSDRPTFWCEKLASDYNMTMHNFAISGSTTGYCKGLISRDPNFITLVGNYVATKKEVKTAVEESDYAFIYFGNNDATYSCNIGEYGDVNEENFQTKESFKGSYTYLIDQIRSYNPNVRIVCLSLSYSSWGEPAYTRQYLSEVIQGIADYKNAKYIYIYDLWNASTMSTHCPDGIHPQTSGYELIVDRIMNS